MKTRFVLLLSALTMVAAPIAHAHDGHGAPVHSAPPMQPHAPPFAHPPPPMTPVHVPGGAHGYEVETHHAVHARWRAEAARDAEPLARSSRLFAFAMHQGNGWDVVKVHSAAVARAADAYQRTLVSGASTAVIIAAWRDLGVRQQALSQSLGAHRFHNAPYLQQQWDALRSSYAASARLIQTMPMPRLVDRRPHRWPRGQVYRPRG